MEQVIEELICKTNGEGFTDITPHIDLWIKEQRIEQGLLVISTKHTSCSLTINENADPNVLKDLSAYMKALVPEEGFKSISGLENRKKYLHFEEGKDDMPAHIKTALTCSNLSLSINESKVVLGTWQAIYLWEHRHSSHIRKINLHAIGQISSSQQPELKENMNSLIRKTNPLKLNNYIAKAKISDKYSQEEEIDTNLDLLIDRIHDLSSKND